MTEDQFNALKTWVTLTAKAVAHDKVGHHPSTVDKARAKALDAEREARRLLVDHG